MKRVIITIVLIIISSCRSARPVDVSGTTYWQEDACALVSFAEMDGKVGWHFCVERVVATDDDLLEFHVRWTGFGVFRTYIDKLSDAGNRNMYIVDEQGNRYDHVETRGAADEDARLDDNFPSAAGVFVFPATAANHSVYGHAHVANLELIRLLLRRGADPLHRDDNGDTIMELVVRDGQDGALRVLQEERPLHQGA